MQALYLIHIAVLHATVIAYQAKEQFCKFTPARPQ
jgi:hypothetical protein